MPKLFSASDVTCAHPSGNGSGAGVLGFRIGVLGVGLGVPTTTAGVEAPSNAAGVEAPPKAARGVPVPPVLASGSFRVVSPVTVLIQYVPLPPENVAD